MSRILLVSNRLPVNVEEQDGKLVYQPSSGGLATGLNSLDPSLERAWIGWPGQEVEGYEQQQKISRDLGEKGLVPVFLTQEDISLYYEGFANKTIWPLFHYFIQYSSYEEAYWDAYVAANRKFAEVVNGLIQKDDMVWVHDYQLLLLPQMIREVHPSISIGFFLHIPFPSYEVFRVLPWRSELIKGVLGADLVGFHTFEYMQHFLDSTVHILGYEYESGRLAVGDRVISVDVFPMGIDYDKFASPGIPPKENDESEAIRQLAARFRLILSVDRLDYSKGIEQRLVAFRNLLDLYPDYIEKISFVMIVVPSRSNVDQYQELKQRLDELVGQINADLRTFDWTPVQYFYRTVSFSELSTLYQVADVALITPHRDGMNLVAKEFVASKGNHKRGVLILSEMAGAANELKEAILVNPFDIKEVVNALHLALEMDEAEQRHRLEIMQDWLKRFDVQSWASNFISEQRALVTGAQMR